eukprot:CAMPEP_0117668992 /NCGR_PEP_ID=MMETSP0804-20121206/11870_1 /TAXON_ID=1074897 /ORGANISM="Tetraselmis astigmatica, Strain CCMP880" /LENGTH=609 /DNA_ID=CAMNT_0005476971 /DNA_START=286 /DNA_END=2112 /DNA_ORIENTATION=+
MAQPRAPAVKIIDKNMLAERASQEWAKLNEGGRAFQKRVESLLQRNEQWLKLYQGRRGFQKGVETFVKEKNVWRFFERLLQEAAADTTVKTTKASMGLKKQKPGRKAKKDKHNLLGRDYEALSATYTPGRILGEGGFGKVYVVTDHDGKEFACKEINKLHLFQSGMQDMAATEISVMLKLSGNECVMDLRDVMEDSTNVYMILDLCSGGDVLAGISKHFDEKGSYSEADAARLIRMMLEAVKYCHENGVVHRDIKPENFLWTEKGTGGSLKLADFGLAAFMDPTGKSMKERCGTPPYMAPELWNSQPYTTEPDVWSLGVSLTVMLTGEFPFEIYSPEDCAIAATQQEINWELYPWTTLSGDCVHLVMRMLTKDPKARITVDKALQHPWVVEGGTATTTSMTSNLSNAVDKLTRMNEMHEAALRLLAKKAMQTDEIKAIKDAFDLVDEDGDGLITWQQLMTRAHIQISKEDFVAVMRKVDRDQDGLLTLDDYTAIAMQIRAQSDSSKAREAFAMFDKDGNGYITYDSMAEVLKSVGMDLTEDIAVIFKKYDADGDGQISFVEFGIFWQQCIGVSHSLLMSAVDMQTTISTIGTGISDASSGLLDDLLVVW